MNLRPGRHLLKLAWWRPWIICVAFGALVAGVISVVAFDSRPGAWIAVAALAVLASALVLPKTVVASEIGAKAKAEPALEQEQWVETAARNSTPLAPLPAPGQQDDRYMPPDKRDRLRAALEAQARATDERVYWTPKGVARGKAPGGDPGQVHRD